MSSLQLAPDGTLAPWAIVCVSVAGDRIESLISYLDPHRLFDLAGLPAQLRHEGGALPDSGFDTLRKQPGE